MRHRLGWRDVGRGARLAVAIAMVATFLVAPWAQPVAAHEPTLGWAVQVGGSRAEGVVVDDWGNVYTTGSSFVSKLDGSGSVLWSVPLSGTYPTAGEEVAVDGSGSVYTAGEFSGTVDFDPGPGTFNLTSIGGTDGFVLKLDGAGNFGWVARVGGPGWSEARSLAVDGSGNVVVAGFFENQLEFDTGAGLFTLASNGGRDGFVVKLDGSGQFVWAAQFGGTGRTEYAFGVEVDASGAVFTVGQFGATVDFDPGPGMHTLTAQGRRDGYVSKLDASGNFVWVGHVSGDSSERVSSLAIDRAGNIYISGDSEGTADVDPGPGVHHLTGFGAYISKLDVSGNLVWTAQLRPRGNSTIDYIASVFTFAVAVDRAGNVYATGDFQRRADFDPGPGKYLLTSIRFHDGFVLKLDSSGNFGWVARLGGNAGLDIALDGFGNVYAAGYGGGAYVWMLVPPLECAGLAPTLVGTDAAESLTGTSGIDVIHGLDGDDVIRGLGGNDVICGGDGDDRLIGGAGHDVLRGGFGDDELSGGFGSDLLFGGPGGDIITGGPGRDLLRGTGGDDHLNGGAGADEMFGESGNDRMHGGPAADVMRGGGGDDTLSGDDGPDTMWGGPGFDTMSGGRGTDACRSGETLTSCEA